MKNKWHNRFAIINFITTTEYFKVTFFLSVALAAYGALALGVSSNSFIDAIFIPFQFPIFNIFLLTLFFFNTLNASNTFSKKFDFYIIRLKNKKEYLKEYIIINILSVLFHFLLFLLFYFMFLMVMHVNKFNVHVYGDYNISNLVYVIFYLLRYIFIVTSLCVIVALLLTNFDIKITMSFCMTILIGFLVLKNYFLEEFKLSFLLIWTYFSDIKFSTFSIEVCYSLLFILLLEIIIYIVYTFTYKRRRWLI